MTFNPLIALEQRRVLRKCFYHTSVSRLLPDSLRDFGRVLRIGVLVAAGVGGALLSTGCQTAAQVPYIPAEAAGLPPPPLTLVEGDVVKISFPGAPDLNTSQQIRRDGKLALPMVGEVVAAGLEPSQLERNLVALYEPQLVSGQVSVSVVSSSYPIFVTGAVLKPGKIMADRPMSALQAVMEAGGFVAARANPQAVVVVRHHGDQVENIKINLKEVLEGKRSDVFMLKPSDIVFVPERFSWF